MRYPSLLVVRLLGVLFAGATAVSGQSEPGHLRFRLPYEVAFRFEDETLPAARAPGRWLRAWADEGSAHSVEFGDRLVLQLAPGTSLETITDGTALTLSRK